MNNKKGFSLVELLAVIVILGILFGIGVAAYTRYTTKTRQEAYETMVKSAEHAMEEFMMDNPGEETATLEELYKNNYLERPADPSSKSDTCRGKVVAKEDITSIDTDIVKYNYTVSVCCSNYNYTYETSSGLKSADRFCKADPFNMEELKESLGNKGIQVLNVYARADYANYVKNWMDSYGKDQSTGEQVIFVEPISIDSFNANPRGILGASGNWKYDVVIFGFSDCYRNESGANKDLVEESAKVMREFANSGGSIIFGHDTITAGCGNHVNFISIQDLVGLKATSDLTYSAKNSVKIYKTGVFTQYPYNIGNVGKNLTVPQTHVYGQVANGATVWMTFNGISDPNKSIYLSTYGNNAFIQTGHKNGEATADEQKIIANIIFYMVAKQYGAD